MSQLAGRRTFQSVRTVFLTQYIGYQTQVLESILVSLSVSSEWWWRWSQWFQWCGGIVMQCQVLLSEQISVAGWVSIHSRHYLTNLLGQTRPGQHWAGCTPLHSPPGCALLREGKSAHITDNFNMETWDWSGGMIKTKTGITPQKIFLKYQLPTIRSSLQSVLQFIFKARNVLA